MELDEPCILLDSLKSPTTRNPKRERRSAAKIVSNICLAYLKYVSHVLLGKREATSADYAEGSAQKESAAEEKEICEVKNLYEFHLVS